MANSSKEPFRREKEREKTSITQIPLDKIYSHDLKHISNPSIVLLKIITILSENVATNRSLFIETKPWISKYFTFWEATLAHIYVLNICILLFDTIYLVTNHVPMIHKGWIHSFSAKCCFGCENKINLRLGNFILLFWIAHKTKYRMTTVNSNQ